jgi:hypothetical protein
LTTILFYFILFLQKPKTLSGGGVDTRTTIACNLSATERERDYDEAKKEKKEYG